MGDTTDLAADLPPPRDDEPASLRQDILDELADHLHCALRRELLVGGGTTSGSAEAGSAAEGDADRAAAARRRVLERFGSPSQVARKLWLDAMREKLMLQRLTLIAVVLAVVAMFFVERQRSEESARVTALFQQERQANAKLIADLSLALAAQQEQQQRSNEQVLARVAALADRPQAPAQPQQPAEWNRLTVKCVYDKPGGEPAEGVKVKLHGMSETTKSIPEVSETTGSDGKVDLGFVRYGFYELQLSLGNLSKQETFSVRPGEAKEYEVVSPRSDANANVAVKIEATQEPPSHLQGKLWYLIALERGEGVSSRGIWKRTEPRHEDQQNDNWRIVIRPDGRAVAFAAAARPTWAVTIEPPKEAIGGGPLEMASLFAAGCRFRQVDFQCRSWMWESPIPGTQAATRCCGGLRCHGRPILLDRPLIRRVQNRTTNRDHRSLSRLTHLRLRNGYSPIGPAKWWPIEVASTAPPGAQLVSIRGRVRPELVQPWQLVEAPLAVDFLLANAPLRELLTNVRVASWVVEEGTWNGRNEKYFRLGIPLLPVDINAIERAKGTGLLCVRPKHFDTQEPRGSVNAETMEIVNRSRLDSDYRWVGILAPGATELPPSAP